MFEAIMAALGKKKCPVCGKPDDGHKHDDFTPTVGATEITGTN